MDLFKEIKDKMKSNSDVTQGRGLESVITHIEIAERYHFRAKNERDEHLYTDAIYRTNHAFEGILKEAYVVLEGKNADHKSPHEIEEYLLKSNVLQGRVVDLLTNYRQNWRNPSTHDYRLFFSEQESFLAKVTVSPFVSILLDQIIEKVAYSHKFKELENEAVLARERMPDFDSLLPIDKVLRILMSYSTYYIKNFDQMSPKSRSTANAEMAAFIERVAPDLKVELGPEFRASDKTVRLDIVVNVVGTKVAIETREPKPRYGDREGLDDQAAINQLSEQLKAIGLGNGVVFFYPGRRDYTSAATTASTAWPKDLNLREVYSDDPAQFEDEDIEEPVDLVEPS